MRKNKNFFESLWYALSGLLSVIRQERNFRFHLWAGSMALLFGYFFGLSEIQWIILIMTVALVIICELINTAVENAVDTATHEYSPTAKIAKDVAAGAVLVSAIMALLNGLILFGDISAIIVALHKMFASGIQSIWGISLSIVGLFWVLVCRNKINKE